MKTLAAFVALGSNLGEPAATLLRAAGHMDGLLPGVRLAACSRLWLTAPKHVEALEYPWPECLRPGGELALFLPAIAPGPWYANMVVRLDCRQEVTPEPLFEALMRLECELGRNRIMETRWGARFIDIDLLAFGNERRCTPRLILPHPRMFERAFVLLPLAEVAPELVSREKLAGLSSTATGTMIF